MAAEQRNYGLVADLGALEQFVDRLVAAGEPIGFDIETGYRGCSKEKASLHPEDPVSMVVGFSFTNSTAWARYVPLAHDGGPNLDPGEVAPILWRLLSSGLAVAHNCFSGGTEILTGEGMVPLGSVAGREVEVWDGARWRKAPVRSFGRQRTREVVLAPWNLSRTSVRRSYRATDGHRWPVQRRATGPKGGILSPVRWEDRGFVTTDQLQPGDRIPGAVPTDIPDEYSDAFIHGLFYADGARASRQPKGDVGRFQMRLCGDKARFADRFEKVTYPPSAQGDPVINWYPSTVDLKELPYDPSPGYARDFIAGWAALDGADATAGPARIVSTVRESDVAWLHRYAALGGYTVTGSSGPHMSSSSYGGSEFWQVVLVRGAVDWVVKEVGESGDFEEVFCATVPESETFALDAGILTGNCKFEARWMATFFREFLPDHPEVVAANGYTPWFSDTMLESYVAAEFANHGLKFLTKEVFGHEQADLLSLFPGLPKNRQKSLRFNELELTPAVVAYACEDAAWCLGLHEYFFPKVKDSLIYKTEMKVMEILCRMEDEGVCFDWAAIASAANEVAGFSEHMQAAIKAELSELVGREIDLNLGSPAQVGKVLYEDLGLPASNLTDTGKPSTNAAALGMLASEYPVVQAMLDWKEVNTLLTRYLVKFPAEFNYALDNRAHPNHMQAVVPSGRFSVNDPAYQQLPKKYHYEVAGQVLDLNFRDFLIAPEGWRIVGFDYCLGAETRVLTSDFTWKTLGDVEVGDELIGFDEEIPKASGDRYKGKKQPRQMLRPAVVERKVLTKQPTYHMTLEDGTQIRASADHYWVATDTKGYLKHRPYGHGVVGRRWYRTSELTPDHVLHRWVNPWEDSDQWSVEDRVELAWLAGVFDGEGWVTENCVAIGQKPGPVWDRIKAGLDRFGYSYKEYNQGSGVRKLNLTGVDTSARFLSQARPTRLGAPGKTRPMWEGRSVYSRLRNSRGESTTKVRIVNMEIFEDLQELVAIRTSTGTFIAEGLLSHNSQVELRVLAGESGEPALLEAFAQGEDVHQATASLIFATPKEQVSKDQRQKAKGANFSLMYGAGPKNLSEQLRISIDEARELYETYFRIYSSVGAWKSQQIEAGKARGYVTTKFGRRVTIREFASPDHWIRSKGERLCINAPIQGAAADYMKIAMVRADAALKEAGLSEHVRLVMNIHDALEFYVRDDVPTSRVIEVLDPAVSFEVPGFPPILAEWHEGTKWGEVEEIEAKPQETGEYVTSHSEEKNVEEPERGLGADTAVVVPEAQDGLSRADSGPGTVFVDLLDFPYADEFEAFLGWLRGRPGDAEVVVRVADEQVPVGKASLSVSDSGEVATILTGAVVVLGADAVDLGTLGEGL